MEVEQRDLIEALKGWKHFFGVGLRQLDISTK